MAWQFDASHSQLAFVVRHLMITNVRGEFTKFSITADFNDTDLTKSSVEAVIEANSINTRDANRDGHLNSPDFLDSAKYPSITFKSKSISLNGKTAGKLVGDLTIKDVTKEIALDVELIGLVKNPWGKTSAGFSGSGKISRKDWGLNWNVALEAGGFLVGDDIKVEFEVELVKVEETVTA